MQNFLNNIAWRSRLRSASPDTPRFKLVEVGSPVAVQTRESHCRAMQGLPTVSVSSLCAIVMLATMNGSMTPSMTGGYPSQIK
jgi:hypothetical protein